jgi:hypothetical protein
MVRNNYLQQRIKLIAGKSLTYESLNGLSWFVFYLLTLILKHATNIIPNVASNSPLRRENK